MNRNPQISALRHYGHEVAADPLPLGPGGISCTRKRVTFSSSTTDSETNLHVGKCGNVDVYSMDRPYVVFIYDYVEGASEYSTLCWALNSKSNSISILILILLWQFPIVWWFSMILHILILCDTIYIIYIFFFFLSLLLDSRLFFYHIVFLYSIFHWIIPFVVFCGIILLYVILYCMILHCIIYIILFFIPLYYIVSYDMICIFAKVKIWR